MKRVRNVTRNRDFYKSPDTVRTVIFRTVRRPEYVSRIGEMRYV